MLKQKGFTLMELIVVIAILGVLSITGYQALKSTLILQKTTAEQNKYIRALQIGFLLLDRDLTTLHVSPLKEGEIPFYGEKQANNEVLFQFFATEDPITRQGVTSTRYLFKDGRLIQEKLIQNKRYESIILDQIDQIDVYFYDDNHQKLDHWQQDGPPRLIELSIMHKRYGHIKYLKEVNAA